MHCRQHPEIAAHPGSFVGTSGYNQASDCFGTAKRAQTGMGHREHMMRRKQIHAQYPNCWCRTCHNPSRGPVQPCSHMELAATTKARAVLHTPKFSSPRRHPAPRIDLRTKDRMNAGLRNKTILWQMIDQRHIDGPDKWDRDRISRIGRRTRPRLSRTTGEHAEGGGAPPAGP